MPDPEFSELDRRFLAAAIRLGREALGATWPNPAVGAIVLKDGRVVGRGRTAPGGRPHGEPLALARAGAEARGATLYVSLEPCSHHGLTPPCTRAILEAGIARVVAPIADPNPRISGGGFERLRMAGVAVATGALAREARAAHAGHLSHVARGRPHTLLKLAVSADDSIGRAGESRVQVTGEIARRHVQALRSRVDAILVGRGTVEVDDPELTCRLPGLEARSPVRVVLDSDGRIAPDRRVFSGAAPTWLFSAVETDRGELANTRRFAAPRGVGGLDLAASLRTLAEEGITRVLVEGGARVARAFLEADLVDEAMIFRSRVALGGEAIPALAGLPLSTIEASDRFRRVERRRFGADVLIRYLRER
jgi:diaminohydroxyphosphoribosylaminopyrimidine deaminase/5-amino-6-(5-phosphoribosylamino)uracil reductase